MRDFDTQLDVIFADSITVHFGIETAILIGKLTVDSFIDRIDFHVMKTDISFLLCLQDINRLEIYLNNLKDQIVLRNEFTVSIVRFHEYFFLI